MRKRIDPKPILLAALKGEQIPPGRKMGVVYSRFIFANHLRTQGETLEEIGNRLSKDHATVSHYINKYTVEYMYNPEFRELADWFNLITRTKMKYRTTFTKGRNGQTIYAVEEKNEQGEWMIVKVFIDRQAAENEKQTLEAYGKKIRSNKP